MEHDEEWEYEYSQTETEVGMTYDSPHLINKEQTYLVDLDLTSLNQHVAPATGKKVARSLQIDKNRKSVAGQSLNQSTSNQRDIDTLETQNPGNNQAVNDDEEAPGQDVDESTPTINPQRQAVSSNNDLQLLDIATGNPLVAYQGNLYSCTWVDMVGTNMFFTDPEEPAAIVPEVTTKEYNLLGTARIKLVGQQAKVTPLESNKNGKGKATKEDIRPGASLGDLKFTNPKTNMQIRKQANFLQKLIDIKKAKGDADIVRIVASSKINSTESPSGLQSPTKRKQIDELNTLALQGNGEALKKLKRLYSGLDNMRKNVEQNDHQNHATDDLTTTEYMPADTQARSDQQSSENTSNQPSPVRNPVTTNANMQRDGEP